MMNEAGRGARDILLLSNTLTRLGRPLWREALWREGAQQQQQEDRLAVWGEAQDEWHKLAATGHGSRGHDKGERERDTIAARRSYRTLSFSAITVQ